jgi:hypothetical protein
LANIHFEEQALIAGENKSRQAQLHSQPACFVLCLLIILGFLSQFLQ